MEEALDRANLAGLAGQVAGGSVKVRIASSAKGVIHYTTGVWSEQGIRRNMWRLMDGWGTGRMVGLGETDMGLVSTMTEVDRILREGHWASSICVNGDD